MTGARCFLLASVLLLAVAASASVQAQAQPILPDKFYGTVRLAGIDAAAGTRIDVYLSGGHLSTYVMPTPGKYAVYVSNGDYGNPISFMINGVSVGSSTRTGGLMRNLNLSLSPAGSSSQTLSSHNGTMAFVGKDSVSADIDITTSGDVADQAVEVSAYEDGALGGFFIAGNQTHVKSIAVTINASIVDHAILKIYYTDAEVAGLEANSLRIYHYNEASGTWEAVPQQGVNATGRYVWANVTHFSTYGLFGKELSCGDGYCSGGETCSSCPEDCGTCPAAPSSGGGGTGGGGGGSAACVPMWSCTDWSDCAGGQNSRQCVDARSCGTDEGRPGETKECSVPAAEGPKVCIADLRVCAGSDLMECTGQAWQKVQSCDFGCSDDRCNPKPEGITGGITIGGIDPMLLFSAVAAIAVIAVAGVLLRMRKR
jgi:hypothetical protein